MSGTLYIVATPIGNLQDITYRAVETLREIDVIVCEDTRVTKRLLERYEITDTQLLSYHQHSKQSSLEKIGQLLESGSHVVYMTDAGTPGISDPGNKLVAYVRDNHPDCQIVPIPGASAVVAALSISGFATDTFLFKGFIPHKKKRKKFLEEVRDAGMTVVFYESVHRIEKLLSEMVELLPEHELVLARELTKQYETVYRGKPEDVRLALDQDQVKGEFVVVVNGN